jgi:selenocysteine lyase/cysteine desulfurase
VDLNHGALRLSFVHYTSEQDIENLIKSLAKNL